MSHFFLRSKHYLLFIPLLLPTLTSWIAQGAYGQQLQEFSQEIGTGSDFSFADFTLADYSGYFYFFLVLMILPMLVQVGWYRAVGQDLKKYLPDHASFNDKTFKITLAVQVISVLAMVGTFWYGWNWLGDSIPGWIESDGVSDERAKDLALSALKVAGLVAIIGLIGFAAAIYNSYFVGKTLKTIEEGRPVKGGELVGYVILSYFLVIGIWIMQPKVNRLVETGTMNKADDGDGVW